jgi:branched-subunit amino acid transport protein
MKNYPYIALMALVTYLIRVLPLTLIRKPIKSVFLRSFLYYVPYVTLSLMTFPAITTVTQSPLAGAAAMAVGILSAWLGLGLFPVSLLCCGTVVVLELLL